MASQLTFRQLLVSFLALWRGLSQKEVAAAAGISAKRISQHLAAGLGQPAEALSLLGQARREFALREMDYDVALALLEEAALLLDAGRTEEVKLLAEQSKRVFESKGVHREALAALRLFRQAVERQEATAELARRILRYLFRARHDQGLRFTP